MKIFKTILFVLLAVCQTALFAQVKVGDTFSAWSEGYLDIHHINSGRGESLFAILPDGTTLMIDAGEIAPSPRTTEPRPDESRSAGEWIARYLQQMMHPLPEKKIDYLLLTHFHADHMGDVKLARERSKKGDYLLSGITEVGDRIPFRKIVDRNWPHYNWPHQLTGDQNMQNYIRFVKWQVTNGAVAEQFEVGSDRQFTLLYRAEQYPGFEIRNIAANGWVWTGVGDNRHNLFPPMDLIDHDELPGENQCSAAIRISYGKFDYFHGGDIVNAGATGSWRDIETPAGWVTGPVEVCKANHHASHDAMGEPFLKAVRPRVIVMQPWSASHPDHRVLQRMMDQSVYPGERDIFSTNLMEATKTVLGRGTESMKSRQGHIVIRVQPGGDYFTVFILDDSAESYAIKSIHGPYECR